MKKTSLLFRIVDVFYVVMMVLPLAAAIVLQVLTDPKTEGISITGAKVFYTIPFPIQDFLVTESLVVSLAVTVSIFFLCLFLTHGLTESIDLKRQHFAELIVEKVDGMVKENMGEFFSGFSPFIISILALSAFSSLTSLLGLYPPTSDINVVGGWAILVFILITYYKLKGGVLNYLRDFTKPVAVLTPINFVSELATPISMAFRHYGNVLSGSVISVLVGYALCSVSAKLLGSLPGFLADIPLLQIGLPAVLSLYFDIFSGCLQAFIFAMLTMVYVSGGFPAEEYEKRLQRKLSKKKNK